MLPIRQFVGPNSFNQGRLSAVLIASRQAHKDAAVAVVQEAQSAVDKVTGANVNPWELDNPNIFQRIYCRFKGIPLKGESQRPKTLFEDIGKYYIYEPLPQVPKDFKEYPERDLVNYPYPNMLEYPRKMRLFYVPDVLCREIEKVSGTSGPYLFLFTFAAFLQGKGIVFINHEVLVFLGWITVFNLINMPLRLKFDAFCYKLFKNDMAVKKAKIEADLKDAVEFRQTSKAEAESLKAAHEQFPTIFQENLALQLESTYRRNVNNAWLELKRRLDYLQEVQAIKDRFMREVLLDKITQGVRKAIETNEGGIRDKYMDQCIDQLRLLAPK